jgi:hypothetical protein
MYSSTLFLDLGSRRGWGISVTPQPLSTPEKDPVPIVQEAEWAPGPVWTGAENLASTGTRSPNLSARSQSLYRLGYPAHVTYCIFSKSSRADLGPTQPPAQRIPRDLSPRVKLQEHGADHFLHLVSRLRINGATLHVYMMCTGRNIRVQNAPITTGVLWNEITF